MDEQQERPLAEVLAEAGVEQPEETVDIFDERAQASFDVEMIVNGMKQIRQAMAAAKVNKELAQAGLLNPELGKMHPEQFKAEIRRHRQGLELLKGLYEAVGDHGLLESTLDTYAAVTPESLTDPVSIT